MGRGVLDIPHARGMTDVREPQNQTPWMPQMTAMSEINRPMPENSATVTSCAESDESELSDADETLIGVAIRTAFGMTALQMISW
ncbi:hypothetical protein AC628_22100 [Bradyrhizobium sp. NAS96.2]|nr:hypothetical protein AC628_22100 [Bradyrhizobium sp. NAS96.2]